jgi:DNA-binding transcriptional LysR family regulator
MDVGTRLLRYFAAVAQKETSPARRNGYSCPRPALTKQSKQLKSQLGVQLFTRSGSG